MFAAYHKSFIIICLELLYLMASKTDLLDIAKDNSVKDPNSVLYACFALQSKIFAHQTSELIKLNKVLVSHKDQIASVNSSIPVPDLLRRRQALSNTNGEKVDDFEILLLGMLDFQGLCI